MKMITLNHVDKITIDGDAIAVSAEDKNYLIAIGDIEKISICTTDQGPFVDDVLLVMKSDKIIVILPSEHPQYETFLFDEISKKVTLDYEKIINASTCSCNREFVLYFRV